MENNNKNGECKIDETSGPATEWWKMPLKKELEDMSRAGYEGVSIMSYHVGIFEQIRSVWGTLDYFLEELKERKLEWARLYWYGKSLTDYKEQRYVIDELKMLSELVATASVKTLWLTFCIRESLLTTPLPMRRSRFLRIA